MVIACPLIVNVLSDAIEAAAVLPVTLPVVEATVARANEVVSTET